MPLKYAFGRRFKAPRKLFYSYAEGRERKKNEKCEDEWYEIDKKENGFCEIRKDAI